MWSLEHQTEEIRANWHESVKEEDRIIVVGWGGGGVTERWSPAKKLLMHVLMVAEKPIPHKANILAY